MEGRQQVEVRAAAEAKKKKWRDCELLLICLAILTSAILAQVLDLAVDIIWLLRGLDEEKKLKFFASLNRLLAAPWLPWPPTAEAKGVAGLGKAGGDGGGGSDKAGQQVPPEVYNALTYAGTAFLLTLSVPLILYGLNKLLNRIEDCFGCGPSSRRKKREELEAATAAAAEEDRIKTKKKKKQQQQQQQHLLQQELQLQFQQKPHHLMGAIEGNGDFPSDPSTKLPLIQQPHHLQSNYQQQVPISDPTAALFPGDQSLGGDLQQLSAHDLAPFVLAAPQTTTTTTTTSTKTPPQL